MTRKERKALERETAINEESISEPILRALIGGRSVSREQATSIPAVASAVDSISSLFALIPFKLYKESEAEDEKKKTEEVGDYRVSLINDDTLDALDGYQMKKAICTDYLLGGAGYVFINRAEGKNRINSIHYVRREEVTYINTVDAIFKNPTLMVQGKSYFPSQFLKLLRGTRDGVSGVGVVNEINTSLTAAFERLKHEVTLAQTGGSRKGFLKSQKQLDEKSMKKLQQAWQDYYDGNTNTVVLNNGLEFQEASCNSRENQVNEKDVTFASTVRDLFHISDDYTSTIRNAVVPIAEAFASALNRDLLLEKEKRTLYFAPDYSDLMKGSMLERFQAYEIASRNGWLSANEIRYREDLDAVAGLDVIRFSLADTLLDVNTGNIYVPNTGAVQNIEKVESEEVNTDEN